MSPGAYPFLRDRAIVVTRPAERSATLAAALRAQGADPVLFPAMEIDPPQDPDAVVAAMRGLDQFDVVIFVSPTAVSRFLRVRQVGGPPWPAGLVAAGIGEGTTAALFEAGIPRVLDALNRFDSEGLLALPEFAAPLVRRILVVRGEGGRELLVDTLRERGAQITTLACYRRMPPRTDPRTLIARWRAGGIDALTFSSSEGLGYFVDVIGASGRALLAPTPVFASHPRIAAAAFANGMRRIITVEPGDDALVAALGDFFALK